MANHWVVRNLVVLTLLLVRAGFVRADPPLDEKALAQEFHPLAKREASAYTIRLEGRDRPLTLQTEPVLKWSNPVVGTVFGEVFIWTDDGRPEVVASIYKYYSPRTHRANEFHSLAVRKLRAERDGPVVWAPARPGLELTPIPGAAAPAGSAPARLRQMRSLAQEFTGRQTSREGVDREMRLLTQPIYRYENTKADLVDGAMFVFVLGTDPEAFLMIEARQPQSGAPEWRFGAARMNSINVRIYHRGREVWTAPEIPWARVWDVTEPYTLFRYEEETAKP
jgi:hypothetical protein